MDAESNNKSSSSSKKVVDDAKELDRLCQYELIGKRAGTLNCTRKYAAVLEDAKRELCVIQVGQLLLQPGDVVRGAQERQGHEVGKANDVTQVGEVLISQGTQIQV